MVNIKVNPKREELIVKRFWYHIILTFALLYPLMISQLLRSPLLLDLLMPLGLGKFMINYPSTAGLFGGLLSIYAVGLGALSMEIHSVSRKLITFPLFLINLLCALMYAYIAL